MRPLKEENKVDLQEQELSDDDLEEVAGGLSLKNMPTTDTVDIKKDR